MDQEAAVTFIVGREVEEEEEQKEDYPQSASLDEESVDNANELEELRTKTNAMSLVQEEVIAVSVTRPMDVDMKFGLVESPVIKQFTYNTNKFPGIDQSKFVRDLEINQSKLPLCYKQTSMDWNEFYCSTIKEDELEHIENRFFQEQNVIYSKWHGTDFGSNAVPRMCSDIVKISDIRTKDDVQNALLRVLDAIDRTRNSDTVRVKRIRFVIAFLLELIQNKESESTLGWVITAIFVFQVVTNLLVRSHIYSLPNGIEIDKKLDNMNVEHVLHNKEQVFYNYTLAHYLFEVICKWVLGFRVPGALLRPESCIEGKKRSASAELYLRIRTKQFDKDFVDYAIESVFEYILNIHYDYVL